MKLPKGVHVVRKKRRDETEAVYYYWRATGTRLPSPDDPKFSRSLVEAKRFRPVNNSRTIGALIEEFKRTPRFGNLSKATRRSYNDAFDRIYPLKGVPVAELKRRHALQIQDSYAHQPGNAQITTKVLSMLMGFAVERDYRDYNPLTKVKRVPVGEHSPWPDEAVAYALANLPEHLRRAMVLALYTGQRRGDCAAMRWSSYDGEGIQVQQIKTGAAVWVPCHRILRAELDAWKREAAAVTILVNGHGRPWPSSHSLGATFSVWCQQHTEVAGLTFHGLRKTAAAKLAEAGCSLHELAAITGHRTLKMLEAYTKGADQKVRARAAIVKLEAAGNRMETSRKTRASD